MDNALKKFLISGKSEIIKELIRNRQRLFSCSFQNVILCVPKSTEHLFHEYVFELKEALQGVAFQVKTGLPDPYLLHNDPENHSLLILEDMADEIFNSDKMRVLFTQLSHHGNVRLFFFF